MPRPTAQQQAAIDAEGDVLVMAGAGSGKTTTLVARILDRVLDRAPRIPLDRILVVTFNEAAAAEMRQRLRAALQARTQAAPDDGWTAEQLALLETASVSTLHAFCLQLVREHFHHLGLDPQFSVLDEAQTAILRTEALAAVLRSHYDGSAPQAKLIRPFLERHARPDDRGLRDLILRVHDYARSLPSASAWLEEQRTVFSSSEPRAWRDFLPRGTSEWASAWLDHTRRIAQATPENAAAGEAASALERLTSAAAALNPTSPEAGRVPRPRDEPAVAPTVGLAGGLALPANSREFPTGTDPLGLILDCLRDLDRAGDPKRFPRGTLGRWRKPLERLFNEASSLLALLAPPTPGSPDPLVEDWGWTRPDALALLELVEQYDCAFASARRAAAGVDFADLEQLALALLWDPTRQEPTRLASDWRRRFDLVFVDEYQDINGAQDRIIGCLGRNGPDANRFFVGDVKQSIYRFRRADPRIFRQYARLWGSDRHRAAVPLQENFRSHEAILAFVNALFRPLMRDAVGGVAYGPDAELVFGAPEARTPLRVQPAGRVELRLLIRGAETAAGVEAGDEPAPASESGEEDLATEEAQARLVAIRLEALRRSGLTIWDSALGFERSLTWRDVVVLHPAPRPVAEEWARQFAAAGIPFEARRAGFFDAPEVSDLVHLIRLLDNPLQDLPLLAVLRSPLVGLTLNELAALRLALPRRDARLWDALVQLARHTAPTDETTDDPGQRNASAAARLKAGWFLERFEGWRRLAREASLAIALEAVLAATSYEAWLGAQPRGRARLANVRQLLTLSRQFDRFQRHGLFRFLQFLEARQEAGDRAENAPAVVGDAVRLLSMHQAKGLEFPVVVVAGLGRRFNLQDLRDDWLLDEEYGLCPPVVPPGRRRGYHSLARMLAGHRQQREFLGEQIRLLYVACTRAVDRLLLVGAARDSSLARWAQADAEPGIRDLLEARCGLDWLGPLLPALTGNARWAEIDSGSGRLLDWQLVRGLPLHESAARMEGPAAAGSSPVPAAPRDRRPPSEGSLADGQQTFPPTALQTLRNTLAWNYPWTEATHAPAKAAVTTLRRQWQSDAEAATTPLPRLHSAHSATAVQRGTLHHLFCELVRLPETDSSERLAAEVRRLYTEGWIAPEELDHLDLSGLWAFWGSSLGDELRAHAPWVHRELPFTARLRPREAIQLGAPPAATAPADDDFQVVQGVIDLAVLKPDEIWIVDFKTDQVSAEDTEARAAAYASQLRLYAHALANIYRRPVTRLWLYFLTPRRLVPVTP